MRIHLFQCVFLIYLVKEYSLLTQSFSILSLDCHCTLYDFTHCVFFNLLSCGQVLLFYSFVFLPLCAHSPDSQ